MKDKKVRLMTLTGMFTALVCAATLAIRIPTPTNGYVNFGDCVINIAAWILDPFYGVFAGGVGSALADLISGYTIYALPTLIIKGTMSLVAWAVYVKMRQKDGRTYSLIIAAVASELLMSAGYLIFESFLYGPSTFITGIPSCLIQGGAGAVSAVVIYKALGNKIPHTKSQNI